MTRLNVFISGHVRTLYECFPATLKSIRASNPGINVDIYYSFWDSEKRIKNREVETGHADGHWASVSNVGLTKEKCIPKNINMFFEGLGCVVKAYQIKNLQTMEKIIKETPFKNENKNKVSKLSSQYYQIKEACLLYKDISKDDVCMRLRADVLLNSFPNLELLKDDLVVNTYVWEGQKYNGSICNEMVWLSKAEFFNETCFLYDVQNDYKEYEYGENVTGHYFLNLCKDKKIKRISTFNFDYRILR